MFWIDLGFIIFIFVLGLCGIYALWRVGNIKNEKRRQKNLKRLFTVVLSVGGTLLLLILGAQFFV